ncbi:MAG TPA: glycine zipper domain-containing protein [Methylomirabilota bacterium]|nr:glycine zipper domain-containing protein [Methylomirabilota bacterium]
MKATSLLLVVVLVATLGLSGCATIEENPKTAVGVGVGAAGGAVLGGVIGRSTTAVVIGGLLGGLAGGVIGQYLDRQDRTRAQAVSYTGYNPAQGTVVRVERVEATPSPLTTGSTVNVVSTYTVLTPDPAQLVGVREVREVRHNGALVANPTTEVQRPNGTFTSAVPITLPPGAPRGTYEVMTTVSVGDRSSRGMTTFTVN